MNFSLVDPQAAQLPPSHQPERLFGLTPAQAGVVHAIHLADADRRHWPNSQGGCNAICALCSGVMRSVMELIWPNARPEIRRRVRGLVQVFGYDIRAIDDYPTKRPIDFIRSRKIDVVVDVGANARQYAGKLRKARYRGWIVSLEPVRETFEVLKSRASGDPYWITSAIRAGTRARRGNHQCNRSSARCANRLRLP